MQTNFELSSKRTEFLEKLNPELLMICLCSRTNDHTASTIIPSESLITYPFVFVLQQIVTFSPSQSYQNRPGASSAYYGMFGSKRISNQKIVVYCMIFMVVGAIVQALAIR